MTEASGEEKFLLTATDSVHYVDGQAYQLDAVLDTNMTDPEMKDTVAAVSGCDPEDVQVIHPGDKIKDRGARVAVAFSSSRWKSSWDPKAQNADLN
ncbi:MAG TPA: hypothetical protein VMT23_03750 [Candidatus Binatia bacterium]|nr:hypothetical protein [Candidatus Binatia bacterium]